VNIEKVNTSSGGAGFIPNPKLKLLDQVSEVMRFKHYSIRTERTYREWIKRFIFFHGKRHPREMGAEEVGRFLSDLALTRQVAASTQNQAFNALLFLYRQVLHQEFGQLEGVERAKRPERLPMVLTREEVQRVLAGMSGTHQLMAKLLYGTGMRLMECVRLRVKDVDFGQNHIVVRDGKGFKDRVTLLPDALKLALNEHLKRDDPDLHARDAKARAGRQEPAGRLNLKRRFKPLASVKEPPEGALLSKPLGFAQLAVASRSFAVISWSSASRTESGSGRAGPRPFESRPRGWPFG
jgi:integrase